MKSEHTFRFNRHSGLRVLLLIAVQWLVPVDASAVNKCVEEGKVTYQDAPCKNDLPLVGDNISNPQHNETLYKKLDRLAAMGRGLVQQQPAPVQVASAQANDGTLLPRKSREQIASEREQRLAERAEISAATNAKSTAALTNLLETTKQKCGDKLVDYPAIGMSDEFFRNCTTHARFGGINQLVISDDGAVPIKLYLFSSARAQRVYVIGGIITAIKP